MASRRWSDNSLGRLTCWPPQWMTTGRRPDNCEYPWEDDGGALHLPAEHGFGPLGTLHRHRAGATFLKIVAAAAAELAGGFYAAS
ncbi:MAG: hypothetical protein ABSH35_01575 [Isosphaeraceae bacterium]